MGIQRQRIPALPLHESDTAPTDLYWTHPRLCTLPFSPRAQHAGTRPSPHPAQLNVSGFSAATCCGPRYPVQGHEGLHVRYYVVAVITPHPKLLWLLSWTMYPCSAQSL
jgi:hypothetical protein